MMATQLVAMEETPRKYETCNLNEPLRLFEEWGNNLQYGRETNRPFIAELKVKLQDAIDKDTKDQLILAIGDTMKFMKNYEKQQEKLTIGKFGTPPAIVKLEEETEAQSGHKGTIEILEQRREYTMGTEDRQRYEAALESLLGARFCVEDISK